MAEQDTLDGKRPDALIQLEAYCGQYVALELEFTEKRGATWIRRFGAMFRPLNRESTCASSM